MKNLILAVFVLSLFLISSCTAVFEEFTLSQNPSDCKKNQYYDASDHKCKKIINECYSDSDCTEPYTCERKEITTSLACRVGEECPKWFHNVCELTEETRRYCEPDSDCVWAFRLDSCCSCPNIYGKDFVNSDNGLVMYETGKDYSSLITVDCSGVYCAPCAPVTELVCINNKCEKKVSES